MSLKYEPASEPLHIPALLATDTGVPRHNTNRCFRCRENMAHTRQSRPDFGLGVQAIVLKTF